MCGIFGYVGTKENAAEIVLEGLKLLEYRGYDSWGVTVKIGKKLGIDKHVGKIGSATVNLPKSTLGIGHTRWATHGGVTEQNAHPHLDCNQEVAVIHNGIVENHDILRKELKKKGHVFLSETDTEVISHLIGEYLKKEGFASAVRDTFNRLKGLNAIVVAYAPSREIVACKTGSPLVVGKANDGYYVASDATGIIRHTKKIIFLKDNEMVILGKKVKLVKLPKGSPLPVKFETIKWKIEEAEKGSYRNFMEKEIHEEPTVIERVAHEYKDQIEKLARKIKRAKGTFFIGAGTAYHASLAGVYLFSEIAKKHVNTAPASEFNYLEDFLNKKSLIIALSQSGETIDVIEPLQRAKEKKSAVVAITNVLGSTIYRMGDFRLLLGAGPEKAVASTKAYIAKISVLTLLVYALIDKTKEGKKILLDAAGEVKRLLKPSSVESIKELADILYKSEHLYTIGRGVSFASALEGALKIKEVSYIHTEGFAGGELKHGTIALIDKGTPCIVFAPKDSTYSALISNATEIKARGGFIIGVSSENSSIFDYWIEVRETSAPLITQAIPLQLLAYFLSLKKGYDPDKPRNLAKSVTVK